jgi:putative chitinase
MILVEGAKGERVKALQKALKDKGFDPGEIDGDFGPGTEAAVLAFQQSQGLIADGKAGPQTLGALGLEALPEDTRPDATAKFTVNIVSKMSPASPLGNIKTHLPQILAALRELNLGDRDMVLMAIATIRAETEKFVPIDEFQSRFNTSPGGPPFNLYNNRRDLGNQGSPDGPNFKGRGFIQLTGRANYTRIGGQIGVDLVDKPTLANDATVAAKILARFLKNHELPIRNALSRGDLKTARREVNGGTHGFERFKPAFDTGKSLVS